MESKTLSVEAEILDILGECQQQSLTKQEILQVFSPLNIAFHHEDKNGQSSGSPSKEAKFKKSSGSRIRDKIMTVTMILMIGGLAATLVPQMKFVRFHGMALLRIALIKALPFWNWTDLYYSRCLVRNPFFELPDLNADDCNLCETLEEIQRVSNVSQSTVIEQLIKRERPFIVTDAMEDWTIMKTDQFWFDNITEMYLKNDHYRVCNINTNLRVAYGDFTRILRKLYSPHTFQWFLHWENCQKDGAKATRQFYRRPYFISNSLDFTGSNWVLMSSDFRGRVYKKIEITDSLLMLYQMRGFNHIRLSPREACRGYCPELSETLVEGEILIVTNLLWMFEYIPGELGDNLAIMSEVSLPSME